MGVVYGSQGATHTPWQSPNLPHDVKYEPQRGDGLPTTGPR